MPTPEATGWLQYTTAMRDLISGGQPDNPAFDGLQIVTVPTLATWDDPVFGNWIAWTQWTDTIPTWGINYIPRQGIVFDEIYQSFLLSFAPNDPDPNLTAAIGADIDALQKTATDRIRTKIRMGQEWKSFDADQKASLPASEWLSFPDWKAVSGFPEQQAQIQSIYNAQLGKFAADTERATDPLATALGKALQDYDLANYQANVIDPGTKTADPMHAFALVPDLASWKTQAQNGQGTSLDISIDRRTTTDVRSSYDVGAGIDVDFGIWGFSVGGEDHHQTVDTTSTEFKMEVKAPSFASITVTPDHWYHGSIAALWPDGPYKAGFDRNYWFGPNGRMNQIMTSIYVAYQPTITVSLSEQDYHATHDSWGASGGISVCGIGFGASYGSSNDSVTFNDNNKSVTLVSHSPNPSVLAVLNDVLP